MIADRADYALRMNHHAVLLALLSAALFGASTPAAKVLLGAADPTVLAGLLYCGAGIGWPPCGVCSGSLTSRDNSASYALFTKGAFCKECGKLNVYEC